MTCYLKGHFGRQNYLRQNDLKNYFTLNHFTFLAAPVGFRRVRVMPNEDFLIVLPKIVLPFFSDS
jgi:hypothetical protein